MSNKSILQSNNESLSANNLDLQSLIDQANALPDAGGIELPELANEGTAADLLSGKELIDSEGNIVTGTIETQTELTRHIASATITAPAGYYANDTSYTMPDARLNAPSHGMVDENGKVTIEGGVDLAGFIAINTPITLTHQLSTQTAKTVTPTKTSQTAVSSGVYTTGSITVAPIPDEYITTTDATASADEIMSGETAYVNGNKVTGTFTIDSELNMQDDLISQIQTALQGKAGGSCDGSDVPTFSVVNNLEHTLFVNGVYCPVGETTSGIPYGALDLFFIMFEDITDFESNSGLYLGGSSMDDYGVDFLPMFYAYGDFIYDYGIEADNCSPSVALLSTFHLGYRNICGILLAPPWDYVNDVPVDGATITFTFN